MTNKELQFALDKALEVAKGKEEQIKYLVNRMELLKELHGKEIKKLMQKNKMQCESVINDISKHKDVIPNVPIEDRAIMYVGGGFTEIKQSSYRNPSVGIQEPDHTSARMTISAIIGIAAGFILALILL
jgi:hypothetical protein